VEVIDLMAKLRCLRGIETLSAVSITAEVCDFRRFPGAPSFMAFTGLVPSEHSSGPSVHRGSITKTGNAHVRRVLVEAACGPEAEDVVQEAMVRALERWTRVREMESPAAYVYRIAVNLHRRRFRRALRETPASGGGAAVNTDPAEIAEAREQVLQALRCLSTDQRVR
jgi:hypothetical protein